MKIHRVIVFVLFVSSDASAQAAGMDTNTMHTFILPTDDSERTPCPAINTLANHGYINRDGKDIDLDDIAQGMQDVFGLDPKAVLGTIGALRQSGLEVKKLNENTTSVDLHSFHQFIRDADMFKLDSYVEDPQQPFSEQLFQNLTDYCSKQNGDASTCTMQDIIDVMIARLQDTCENNPDDAFARNGDNLILLKAADAILITTLQSNPPEEFTLDSTLDLDELKTLVQENKLPDNFVSREERGLDLISPFQLPVFPSIMQQLCVAAAILNTDGCETMPLCPIPAPVPDGAGNTTQEDQSAEVKDNEDTKREDEPTSEGLGVVKMGVSCALSPVMLLLWYLWDMV